MGEDGVMDTLERLGKLVTARGECELFCLVYSPSGLEIVSNIENYVVIRGILKVAEEAVMDHEYVAMQGRKAEFEREAQQAISIMNGMKKPVGGVN